jgi:type IV secretory pathway TrbD component
MDERKRHREARRSPPRGGALGQLQLLTGALAAAVAMYALLAWLLTSGSVIEPVRVAELPPPWPGVLVSLGALLLVAAPLLERRLARPAAAPADAPRDAVLARYRSAKVVGFGLREAAAALGLVLAVVTGQARWAYALCAAALVLMALAWPRAADLAADSGRAARDTGETR